MSHQPPASAPGANMQGWLDSPSVVLATGFLILFMGGGRLAIFGLVFKPMSEDLDLSRSMLSLVVTTSTVVAAPALLLTGRLLDRHSLRLIMGVSTLISGVSVAMLGLVSAPWQVFLLYGVAFPLANPGTAILPVQVMISRWFQRGHGLANAVAQSGSSLGQLVLIGLLATFLADLGWRAAFSVMGLVFLGTVMPLVLALVPDALAPRGPRAQASTGLAPPLPLRQLTRDRKLWSLVVVYVICGFHDTFVSTHLVAFATDQTLSQEAAGRLLAVMGLMALLGVLAAGVMANTLGAVPTTLLCFAIRIVIFPFVLMLQSELAIYAFGLIFAFTFPITAPLVTVFVRDLFGQRNLAVFSSFVLMVHQIGGGGGAFAGGLLFDRTGSYDAAFTLMAALAVVAATATLTLRGSASDRRPVAVASA